MNINLIEIIECIKPNNNLQMKHTKKALVLVPWGFSIHFPPRKISGNKTEIKK